jgi:GTPase SAR1 family protein
VYDATLSDSFNKAKKWATDLKSENPNAIIVIAANKADLTKLEVDGETLMQYTEEINAKHFFTSAKSGEGLNELFLSITTDLASLNSKSGNKSIKIDNETNKQESVTGELILAKTTEKTGCQS